MARVFTLLCAGFGAIIVLLTWWQVVVAGELRQKDENNQTAYYEQRVQRGFITTRDGVRLAGRSAAKGPNGDTIWTRRYGQGSLAAHVLGYDTRGHSRTGVERELNDALTGSTRDLGAVVGLLDGDEAAVGDDVRLTIDLRVQRVAEQQLAGHSGAIVVLEPSTGRVVAMASSPTFSPADVQHDFEGIVRAGGSPLLDRATVGHYQPGSTFKLVTASAALEAGVSPDRRFPGGCSFKVPGEDVHNYGGSCPGPHDLTEALTKSINTSFAELGAELGGTALRDQMELFGFYSTPPLDGLPTDELRASGLYEDGELLSEEAHADVDAARVAIGQERLEVTPLQMALVASAIANDGVLVEPTLVERITTASGHVVRQRRTKVWKTAISPQSARELTRMMENVVREGSGTAANLQGVDVAGKTGTADTGSGNLVWFVAFAPSNTPRFAIAVAIEGQPSGSTGGGTAAPIARAVLETALGGELR